MKLRLTCIALLVMASLFLNAQTRLKRFEIVPKPTPVTTLQVDHPDCAVVIVHSAIPNLHFESNMGKIKAQEYRHLESRYVVFLYPEKQRVSIKSPGFVEAEFPMFSELRPRQQFSYEVNEAFDTTGKGNFTLKSDPPGADITIEQIPIFSEKTPYKFEQFGAMSYGIKLSKARYDNLSAVIVIEADTDKTRTFKLIPQWADLLVNSEPPGSSVYVNKELKGTTPLSLSGVTSGLDPGDYSIELHPALQFYESYSQEITLQANSKAEIDHTHEDVSGYLQINISPQPLEVRLNDTIDRNLALGERTRLLSGNYDIEVINVGENREYYKPYRESFSLEPQDEKQISLILAINEDMAPMLSHETGTYSAPIKVTFKDSQLSNRQIFYTLDGSEPSRSSTMYAGQILINNSATLKAIAYTGQKASEISSASYSMQVSAPVFTPPGGSFPSPQQVAISSATEGVTIRYTTDGSEPGISSVQYSSPISITGNAILKAKAYKSGWKESKLSTANYSLGLAAPAVSSEEDSPGSTARASYTLGSTLEQMIYVPGGIFYNGTSDVTLSSFYMDKYELTQAGYQAVMGNNPSNFKSVTNGPVEQVSWFNAIEYCNRRSMQEGLSPCYSYSSYGTNPDDWPSGWNNSYQNHANVSCSWTATGYRLPTEMEWMFAAKGGNQSQGYTYSGSNTIGNVAWYYSNSGSTTHTVGTKAPNELGLYDMSGNVWEWTWDIYDSYPSASQTNPTGANSGSYRVRRGGSWRVNANNCTVSYRNGNNATYSNRNIGFRCVRVSF